MKEPRYLAPQTQGEVLELLGEYGPRARLVAGGTDAVVDFNRRRRIPEVLVYLGGVPELRYIRLDGGILRIGARTTFAELRDSPLVQRCAPLLAQASGMVHGPSIQNMATLAGNLATAHNAGDGSVALLALGASVKAASLQGERLIPLKDFFVAMWRSVLCPEEMITEIQVPAAPQASGAHFIKQGPKSTSLPIVNLAVAVSLKEGTCQEARIALGAVAPTPVRSGVAESTLIGRELREEVIREAAEVAAAEFDPPEDRRGSPWYRTELVKVMVRRALVEACARAQGRGEPPGG